MEHVRKKFELGYSESTNSNIEILKFLSCKFIKKLWLDGNSCSRGIIIHVNKGKINFFKIYYERTLSFKYLNLKFER